MSVCVNVCLRLSTCVDVCSMVSHVVCCTVLACVDGACPHVFHMCPCVSMVLHLVFWSVLERVGA